MNWSNLSPLILEKIIRYAVVADYELHKDDFIVHQWLLSVCSYSHVCVWGSELKKS